MRWKKLFTSKVCLFEIYDLPLRVDLVKKTMIRDLITIVTVCYNAEDKIEKTLQSVLEQNYRPLQYLIKDGLSTDNTQSIVDKYQPLFIERGILFHYFNEKDSGIFDAMNRTVVLAKGKWINFMNADDLFCNSNVITTIFEKNKIADDVKVVYGNALRRKNFGIRRLNGCPPELTTTQMPASHQAIFVKTAELKTHPFHLEYRFTADYHFIYQLYQRGEKMLYLPVDVAICEAEAGFSASNKLKVRKECAKIKQIDSTWKWRYTYCKIAICIYTKLFFHQIIPQDTLSKYRRWNHKRRGK